MRCTSIFGHRWEPWDRVKGKPEKRENGKYYTQFFQIRHCEKCGFEEVEWMPVYEEEKGE